MSELRRRSGAAAVLQHRPASFSRELQSQHCNLCTLLLLHFRAAVHLPPVALPSCTTYHQAVCAHSPCPALPTPPCPPASSITRQHLADYIATNYTAPRMVISAAGAVDHDALVKVGGRSCSESRCRAEQLVGAVSNAQW